MSSERIDPSRRDRFRRSLVRRAGRLPLPYITGRKEFWSQDIAVDGRVLVPRPETEVLVEAVVARMGRGGRLAHVPR